ncbi:MAG: hypothetical protein PW788_12035 [Micavibrio sp.]|nr:hypothetical protein [Micavibrio sp.]
MQSQFQINHILMIYPCDAVTLVIAPFTRFGGCYFAPGASSAIRVVPHMKPVLRLVPALPQDKPRASKFLTFNDLIAPAPEPTLH